MAQQIINNVESGLLVRTKLTSNFTDLYTKSVDLRDFGGGSADNDATAVAVGDVFFA
jgi:hypothetical protein